MEAMPVLFSSIERMYSVTSMLVPQEEYTVTCRRC